MQQLPFANVNNINSSFNSCISEDDQSFSEEQDLAETWAPFDNMCKKHHANLKIGHINANGIAGFKFLEIILAVVRQTGHSYYFRDKIGCNFSKQPILRSRFSLVSKR